MPQVLGTLVILAAVYAIIRRVDVRLVLFMAALALGLLAQNPMAIIKEFFTTFANERFVVPICTAMGFAYVLRLTGCDQHLVHLLIKPLTKVRWLLIPGTVVAGFIVNIPIISQTSTAATLGPVVIPILLAARISPVTIGATLVLGSSIGGELLNPGAPELRKIVEESQNAQRALNETVVPVTESDCVQRILPLDLLALVGATSLFWWLSSREKNAEPPQEEEEAKAAQEVAEFKINLLKAAIPFLPLALLILTGPPLNLITVPMDWLIQRPYPPGATGLYNSRLIGLAMLIGVLAATLVSWEKTRDVSRSFFEGAGYGFANIISLIVTANCFGKGIELIGLAELIGELIQANTFLLFPISGAVPLGFAALCGSGMASTQSLFGFFAGPAVSQGVDPTLVGAVVALASAAGRTMSPVAAVVLLSGTLTDTNPFDLARRVALPLLFGIILVVIAATILSLSG